MKYVSSNLACSQVKETNFSDQAYNVLRPLHSGLGCTSSPGQMYLYMNIELMKITVSQSAKNSAQCREKQSYTKLNNRT